MAPVCLAVVLRSSVCLAASSVQVMTYGLPNDDPEWVRRQFFLGVRGVIVDDVAGVATALSAALG